MRVDDLTLEQGFTVLDWRADLRESVVLVHHTGDNEDPTPFIVWRVNAAGLLHSGGYWTTLDEARDDFDGLEVRSFCACGAERKAGTPVLLITDLFHPFGY